MCFGIVSMIVKLHFWYKMLSMELSTVFTLLEWKDDERRKN